MRFQPAALPVRSLPCIGKVNDGVAPMVPAKEAAEALWLSAPAVTAPVTTGPVSGEAPTGIPGSRSTPAVSITRSRPLLYRR